MRRPPHLTPVLIAGLSVLGSGLLSGTWSCTESVPAGECAQDTDCTSGQLCLFDLNLQATYCTTECVVDRDCPRERRCEAGAFNDVTPEAEQLRVCVSVVRTCQASDPCNGLDDDCDGVIDNAGCASITGCNDNLTCGAWVCSAPRGASATECVAPAEGARAAGRCEADEECDNGVCETGFCSEFCRGINDDCPGVVVGDQLRAALCVRAVGDPERPLHNKCQVACGSPTDCPNGLSCLWRDTAQFPDLHAFVCAIPDPGRLAAGAPCRNNEPRDGDDQCQSGLCLDRTCTRRCAGAASSCADVGPDFRCTSAVGRPLLYGGQEFAIDATGNEIFVCRRDLP